MVKIGRLSHGGIMPLYQCNAACRHCLYACSPDRSGEYITTKAAKKIFSLLIKGNCRSVHIGGGEPFLNFDGLIALLKEARSAGVRVEYVETNGFWSRDENIAMKYLKALAEAGADTLCISLDPFHAEYVPFELPLRLAELCRRSGFGYFLWQERFLRSLSQADPTISHSRKSLEEYISPSYILETARRYGLGMGGRAINIEKEYEKLKPVADLTDSKTCRNLMSTDHFHVDLHGNFIPPGCTGLCIPLEDVVDGFAEEKYPAYSALLTGGIAKLLELAVAKGFKPADEYTSRCLLCFYTRKWLSENTDIPELNHEHYEASLTYYD